MVTCPLVAAFILLHHSFRGVRFPLAQNLTATAEQPINAARFSSAALLVKDDCFMYSDNFMGLQYTMYQNNAIKDTKCGVYFKNTACILANMEWYKKAKRLMNAKKIKQEDLIDTFGVTTRGAVGHYLTGRRQPDPAQMKALANRLGCTIDDLMTDSEPDPMQEQIARIIRTAELALSQSDHEFSKDERLAVYRVAFAAGLDSSITDDQLISYLNIFVKK